MVLVGETGYISVRRRRREFGVLRGLGWRASSIAWLVELENPSGRIASDILRWTMRTARSLSSAGC